MNVYDVVFFKKRGWYWWDDKVVFFLDDRFIFIYFWVCDFGNFFF